MEPPPRSVQARLSPSHPQPDEGELGELDELELDELETDELDMLLIELGEDSDEVELELDTEDSEEVELELDAELELHPRHSQL